MIMITTKQPTLFDDIDDVKNRKRARHTRVSRKRGDRKAFRHFLIAYKSNMDCNGTKTLKALQDEYKVSHFPRRLLPVLQDLPIEKITQNFADKAYEPIAEYNKRLREQRNEAKPASRTDERIYAIKRTLESLLEQINDILLTNN